MRLPRFRIRTLMIAVAIVGGGSTLAVTWDLAQKSILYRRRARMAADLEQVSQQAAQDSKEAEDLRRFAEYCGKLRMKYLHAASHPWESVPPDPPLPK